MKCSDCGSSMSEGFIPDATYGAIKQSGWHKGAAEESTFLGLSNGIKCDSKAVLPITTYRCDSCGLLKLYAK